MVQFRLVVVLVAGLEPARVLSRGILRLIESQKAQYIVKCDFFTYYILCFFIYSSNPVYIKMHNKKTSIFKSSYL